MSSEDHAGTWAVTPADDLEADAGAERSFVEVVQELRLSSIAVRATLEKISLGFIRARIGPPQATFNMVVVTNPKPEIRNPITF